MTSGDYAFFVYTDVRLDTIYHPWLSYNMTAEDVDRRMKAFGAVKQVTYSNVYRLTRPL